jgi:hypothetical protein
MRSLLGAALGALGGRASVHRSRRISPTSRGASGRENPEVARPVRYGVSRGRRTRHGDHAQLAGERRSDYAFGGMSPSRRSSAATASAISFTVLGTSLGFVLSVVPAQSSLPSLTE